MKKFLICILLIGLIFPQNRNQRDLNRNIDQFRMTSFTRPLESGLVEIMSFVIIPNRSLQFIKEKNKWLIKIKEKEPFTKNKMQEFASNGTYYFRRGEFVKKYFKTICKQP